MLDIKCNAFSCGRFNVDMKFPTHCLDVALKRGDFKFISTLLKLRYCGLVNPHQIGNI